MQKEKLLSPTRRLSRLEYFFGGSACWCSNSFHLTFCFHQKRADPHTKEIPHGIAASTQNDEFADDVPVDRSNRFNYSHHPYSPSSKLMCSTWAVGWWYFEIALSNKFKFSPILIFIEIFIVIINDHDNWNKQDKEGRRKQTSRDRSLSWRRCLQQVGLHVVVIVVAIDDADGGDLVLVVS